MIIMLVLIIALVVFFACFFGFNLSNFANLWLFTSFEHIPVAVVVLISFAAGAVFAMLCYMIAKLKRSLSGGDQAKDTEEKSKSSDKINKGKRGRGLLRKASQVSEGQE